MKWISSCHKDIASKLENVIPCLHRGEHAWPTTCRLCIWFYWSTASLRPYLLLVAVFTWQTLNWVDRDSLAWKAQNSYRLVLFQKKFVLSLDSSLCKNASISGYLVYKVGVGQLFSAIYQLHLRRVESDSTLLWKHIS